MMAFAFSIITGFVPNDTTSSSTKHSTNCSATSTSSCATYSSAGACANQYACNGFFFFGASGKRNQGAKRECA
jgi:hypothetical protein